MRRTATRRGETTNTLQPLGGLKENRLTNGTEGRSTITVRGHSKTNTRGITLRKPVFLFKEEKSKR